MNRSPDHASVLLQKARDDAWMMAQLMEKPDSPEWGIGFHAQQAVEKSLKAVLSDHGVEYPRTHDLVLLMELLERGGIQRPADESTLDGLSPYGAPLRYENLDADLGQLDPAWVRAVVQRTLAWAENLLAGGDH
jgi:HEPN domain